MANSFLDKTGLAHLWSKIVALVGTKQDALTFDNSPTNNSSNPVKSGGVYSALAGKAASDHTQAVNKGGTNITSYTTGDILYASGATTLSKLNGNTTTTKKFLKSVATTSGTATAPAWDTLAAGDIPDLSWSKITSGKPTTLSGYGITDAAASGHTQAVNKGGTNITSYTTGDILYASGSTTLAKLAGNTTTTKKFLKSVATTSGTAVAPAWDTLAAADIPNLDWSKITSGKPTTLSGYGITDAAASGHTQAVDKGGTNITSYAVGDILYASGTTTLSKLAGNTTTTQKFLAMTGTGSAATAPQWVEASGGDILVVTVTYASNLYFANKTLSEIITAFNNGKVVFAKYSSEKIYTLRTLSSTAAVFSRLYYLSNGMYEDTCTITSNNVTMSTTRRISNEIVEYLTIEVEYSDSEGRYTASCYQLDNPSVWDIYNFLDSNLKNKYVRVLMYKYGTSTVPSGASDPPEEPYYCYWYNVTDASAWYEWNSYDEYWQMRHSIALSCIDSRGSEPKLCTITITDTEDGEGSLLANATVTYTESALGGDYLPLSGGTMTGSITLNNGVAMYTAQEAGWSMNQYGNLTHRRTNASDYFGIIGGSGDFRVYYDSGNVGTNGNIEASGNIVAAGGNLYVDKSDYPYIHFRNASGAEVGGVWANVSSKRVYIRVRPSVGSGYATDMVFPAANASANENVYVYTSRNISYNSSTKVLAITSPS